MSGPIVRSGPSVKFSSNWDQVFSKKKPATSAGKAKAKVATKVTTKAAIKAKKKSAKKKK